MHPAQQMPLGQVNLGEQWSQPPVVICPMRPVVLLPDAALIFVIHAVIVVSIHRTVKTIYAGRPDQPLAVHPATVSTWYPGPEVTFTP
jgi:hypothetical protein